MTNSMPTNMDRFLELISTTDTKMRLDIGPKLLSYLSDPSNSIICSDIGLFIDMLVKWLPCSNWEVVQIDLDILSELINRMKADFHPYSSTLIPHLVDRLKDCKEVIREKTSCLLLQLVECHVITLQNLFNKIAVVCFTHKNSNVREQIMYLLCNVLDSYDTSSFSLNKLVPHITKCLSDPNASVRAIAFDTLCKIYKHVGERLRIDLLKKNGVPANKLPSLLSKFDEIRASDGGVSDVFQMLKVEDEVDEVVAVKRNGVKSTNSVFSRPPITPTIKSRIASSASKSVSSSSQAGAVDDETFLENFEKVPTVKIYSARDVEECLKKCYDVLSNKNEEWENRVDCLKKVRSLVLVGGLKYDEFYEYLNKLLPPFQFCMEDLRSMIAREACITVAFLSKNLENKFDHFAESILSSIINLIQKSQKVFATSGVVCVRFILQYTHAPRLIPIITNSLNSKSKDIRRACCEFVSIILQTWHTHIIERYLSAVQEAIKKGIADADADTRVHSRKAYAEFAQHFPDAAESLKNSLDFSYRKLLLSGSNSGSSSSLNVIKSSIPRSVTPVSLRSNSAIDLQAVKRAKARAQYAALARQKFGAGATSSPSKRIATTPTLEPRSGRTKSRISVSQPSSRSGSPSSRLSSYTHYLANNGTSGSRSRKSSFGNDTSRETSPNRSFSSPFGFKSRVPTQSSVRRTATQRMLLQSREAEVELADALGHVSELSSHMFKPAPRNVFRSSGGGDHSDESETSSICSEQSFGPYDSMSWDGSQHRLYRDLGDLSVKSVSDIVACCESSHWNERKKGLISLQYYIQEGNRLELADLKKVMDTFLKIFNDSHIKVFSLFLDALNELIMSHSRDLCFCLHLLLTRLFNKLGTDLLNSVHSKIMRTLDNVFVVFPHDLQMQSVFRFLVDPTQTPNNRVKLAALNYVIKLTTVVDSCTAFSSNNTSKDYATMALTKMISWTLPDNMKCSPELRKVSQEAIVALFNLNTSQVTRRLSSMSSEYQEIAANICKEGVNKYKFKSDSLMSTSVNSSLEMNLSCGSPSLADSNHRKYYPLLSDLGKHSNDQSLSNGSEKTPESESVGGGAGGSSSSKPACDVIDSQDASATLKAYLDDLSQVNATELEKRGILVKVTKFIEGCSSDAIITHFKPLLGKIVALMSPTEPSSVKEKALNLLQQIVKRKTIIFLLKQFSDLIITKVITVYDDPCKEVVKAAENCAMALSAHLPADSVVRIIVPLISTSEAVPVKLISIKMLTRVVESSDNAVILENIYQIMPLLLVSYEAPESSVRKAAVFCMVALYKQSEEMTAAVEPYIEKLQGAKKKLLELYIHRAEQSLNNSQNSSITTSRRNS